jgi:hypothetical protein
MFQQGHNLKIYMALKGIEQLNHPRIPNDPVLDAVLFPPPRNAHYMVMMCFIPAKSEFREYYNNDKVHAVLCDFTTNIVNIA